MGALVFLFPVSEVALAFMGRAKTRVVRRADEGSLRSLWITIAASVTLGMVYASNSRAGAFAMAPMVRDLLAAVLLAGGLLLRWTAIRILGRFFTVDVAIHEGHSVVDTGPYRYVRHPSYTGLLVAFLGLGIYCGNWVSVGMIFVPITLAFIGRIRTEEAALTRALGSGYSDYCGRTARLIPGIY